MRCLICRIGSTFTKSKLKETNAGGSGSKSTPISKTQSTNEKVEDGPSGFKMFKLYQKLVQVLDPTRPNRLPDTDFLPPEFEYVCPICAKYIYGVWKFQQKLEMINSDMDLLIRKIKNAILLQSNKEFIYSTATCDYGDSDLENESEHNFRQGDSEEDVIIMKEEIPMRSNGNNHIGIDKDDDIEDMEFGGFPIIIPSKTPLPPRKRRRNNKSSTNKPKSPIAFIDDSFDVNYSGDNREEVKGSGKDDNGSDSDFSPKSPVSDDDFEFEDNKPKSKSESKNSKSLLKLKSDILEKDYKNDNGVTYGVTRRGKPQLIYEGHFYALENKNPSTGHERWRCCNRMCKGALGLFSNGKVKLGSVPHLPEETSALEFRSKMSRQKFERLASRTKTVQPPEPVLSPEASKLPSEIPPNFPTKTTAEMNRKGKSERNDQLSNPGFDDRISDTDVGDQDQIMVSEVFNESSVGVGSSGMNISNSSLLTPNKQIKYTTAGISLIRLNVFTLGIGYGGSENTRQKYVPLKGFSVQRQTVGEF